MSLRTRRSPLRLLLGLGLSWAAGCSGTPEPAQAGQACFRALDCRSGLVCVEGRCSAEIDTLVPEGAGPAPEAAADAGAE